MATSKNGTPDIPAGEIFGAVGAAASAVGAAITKKPATSTTRAAVPAVAPAPTDPVLAATGGMVSTPMALVGLAVIGGGIYYVRSQ